jgi:hypothetical protein
VVVARATTDSLVKLPARVQALSERCANVGVLLVGKSTYATDDLGEFIGTPHVWTVGAVDDLAELAVSTLKPGRARRSWLWRNAVEVAADVAAVAHEPTSPQSMPSSTSLSTSPSVRSDGVGERLVQGSSSWP